MLWVVLLRIDEIQGIQYLVMRVKFEQEYRLLRSLEAQANGNDGEGAYEQILLH